MNEIDHARREEMALDHQIAVMRATRLAREQQDGARKLRRQAFSLDVLSVLAFIAAMICLCWAFYSVGLGASVTGPLLAAGAALALYFFSAGLAQLIYIRAALEDRK